MQSSAIRAGAAEARGAVARSLLRRAALADLPFLSVIFVYATAAFVLSRTVGIPADFDLAFSWTVVTSSAALFGVTAFFVVLVNEVAVRSHSIYRRETWQRTVLRAFPPFETLNFGFFVLSFPLFAKSFTAFKASIPSLHPFGSLDILFMELDRLVHLGQHPWTLLQPMLGHPWVTWALSIVYLLWFPVLWITLLWQAWRGSRATPTRAQFMLAFVLCWIVLGNILAVLLSSAGPVYFEAVTGMEGPYDGLLAYLAAADAQVGVRSLAVQETLWQAYRNSTMIEIGGISAMPSLHVATSVLLVFVGFRIDRRLGWAYAAFALLMFLASIHLAWHYAIDGYAGALGAVAIWWASGRIVGWWRRRAPEPA